MNRLLSSVNKNGLTRYIPSDIKLQVRKNCGFGCVVCGLAITQYEHFDPEFKDATSHEVAGIILLCAKCHDKKTRGFLSRKAVQAAISNPKALQNGFTKSLLDIGTEYTVIRVASSEFTRCPIPFEINEVPAVSIKPPEEPGGVYRLSGTFYNPAGSVSVVIRDNELVMYTKNWDIKAEGGRFIISDAYKIPHLIITTNEHQHLVIEKLITRIGKVLIEANTEKLIVRDPLSSKIYYKLQDMSFSDCSVGIKLKA